MKTEMKTEICRPHGLRYIVAMLMTSVTAIAMLISATVSVYADTPAASDFGQGEYVMALNSATDSWSQAVFVTFYPDGHGEMQMRMVRGDAENTLVGDHPGWHLDHSLTWFVQLPVYVRQLSEQNSSGMLAV